MIESDRFEAKRLASYASHSGLTSKMWILPDGEAVSLSTQHYEWAIQHADELRRRYEIDLRRFQTRGDTPVRMQMLRHGCVRANYEHKGGRLTFEAHYLHWGPRQIKGCRAVIRANAHDLSFIVIRLLNKRCQVVDEETMDLTNIQCATAVKRSRLLSTPLTVGSRAGI